MISFSIRVISTERGAIVPIPPVFGPVLPSPILLFNSFFLKRRKCRRDDFFFNSCHIYGKRGNLSHPASIRTGTPLPDSFMVLGWRKYRIMFSVGEHVN